MNKQLETTYKYKAFISYSHQDKKFGRWLHKEIENYKIPKSLREKYPNLPKDLKRSIFIDDEELPTSDALPNNLSNALKSSELLIVVCSPGASQSYWVDKEIAYFKQYHDEGKVLAVLKEGEPNATYSSVYDSTLEAFPKSLRYKIDANGIATEERTEPLAADARKRTNRKKALIKLIAGILKVDFADLWERDKKETRKRRVIYGSLLAMFIAVSIYASVQFLGEQGNKELEQITHKIVTIEYSIRHDELPVEKVIALNKELKKLKVDKENKEASQEALGKLKTSLGKKAERVYQKEGAKAAIKILTSKTSLANQESRLKDISKEMLVLAKLYVETYEFDKAEENLKKASELFFDYENIISYANFLSSQKKFKKAIEIYKKLLTNNLENIKIANVLTLLSHAYVETNRYIDAEKALLKGLKIYRETETKSNNIELAIHLRVLGSFYLKTGMIGTSKFLDANRNSEKALKEAVEIIKELVKNNPNATIFLTATLGDLGIVYMTTNRYIDAEKALLEAVEISRKLVNINPRPENSDKLASSLTALSLVYIKINRNTDAEKTLIKAIGIYRKLAKINPTVHNGSLATSLYSLGKLYKDIERYNDAEKFFIEAIKKARAIIRSNPEAYNNNLALYLNRLGKFYYERKRYIDAEELFKKAIKIYRGWVKSNPEVSNDYFTVYLEELGWFYHHRKRYLEAVKIGRELIKINFKVHASRLALFLDSLSMYYINIKRYGDAEKVLLESIDIYRKLVKTNPKKYSKDLASRLRFLNNIYRDMDRYLDTEKALLELIDIYRKLVKTNPKKYNGDLAVSLYDLGLLYVRIKHYNDAEKSFIEALDLYRLLGKVNPDIYTSSIAESLRILSVCYRETSQFEKAKNFLDEALSILRTLGKKNPDTYNPALAFALYSQAKLYTKNKLFQKTEDSYIASLKIYRLLSKKDFDIHGILLLTILESFTEFYDSTHQLEKMEKISKEILQIKSK